MYGYADSPVPVQRRICACEDTHTAQYPSVQRRTCTCTDTQTAQYPYSAGPVHVRIPRQPSTRTAQYLYTIPALPAPQTLDSPPSVHALRRQLNRPVYVTINMVYM